MRILEILFLGIFFNHDCGNATVTLTKQLFNSHPKLWSGSVNQLSAEIGFTALEQVLFALIDENYKCSH
jgi:hypothetical protein